MGYRGKVTEQEEARRLRAQGMTMPDIAAELGVSKSSVSLWTRDVEFEPSPGRRSARRRAPNVLQQRKQTEIDHLLAEGRERIGRLSEREFLVAGAALYAGEGGKTAGKIVFPNSDPGIISFVMAWLRRWFEIDERRLRVHLYLHRGLDLQAATLFWAAITGIPESQFIKPYRAEADPSIRRAKHPMGCPSVYYCCSRTHRAVMGLVTALLSSDAIPG